MGEKKVTGMFPGYIEPAPRVQPAPRLVEGGKLDLDGMVTARRPLDEINEVCADMKAGKGIRTVLDIA